MCVGALQYAKYIVSIFVNESIRRIVRALTKFEQFGYEQRSRICNSYANLSAVAGVQRPHRSASLKFQAITAT